MKRFCIAFALAALPVGIAFAATGARPAAFDHAISRLATVEMRSMAAVDVPRLQAEDRERATRDLPPRFAQPLAVNLTPLDSGSWEDLDADTVVWRLRVFSRGALSLNFGFSEFAMPQGGRMLVYPAGQSATSDPRQVRVFTAATTKRTGNCGRR